jgi:hypothetical protein
LEAESFLGIVAQEGKGKESSSMKEQPRDSRTKEEPEWAQEGGRGQREGSDS